MCQRKPKIYIWLKLGNLIHVCVHFYLFNKYILTVFFKRWMALTILL